MGLQATLTDKVLDGSKNVVRELWDHLHQVPGGSVIFSKFLGRAAPYTGTIDARVEELWSGFARVSMKDRPGIRNHLRSVHAIALLNLAEVTGNTALAYSLPDEARFIVSGMSIDYEKKARGTITGLCHCPLIEGSERREYEVPVTLLDTAGDTVATVTLRTLVGPK